MRKFGPGVPRYSEYHFTPANIQTNRLGVCIREKVGVVVAGEADDMGYDTKEGISIDKECVGIQVTQSLVDFYNAYDKPGLGARSHDREA